MAKERNVYIKPNTNWTGKLRFHVGHQPSDPSAHPCNRLGRYWIIVDNLFSAQCVAKAEAKRLGGRVIECPHYDSRVTIAA